MSTRVRTHVLTRRSLDAISHKCWSGYSAKVAVGKGMTAMHLVATPLPENAMECGECGRIETDGIFLDLETCGKCGGMLTAVDTDD